MDNLVLSEEAKEERKKYHRDLRAKQEEEKRIKAEYNKRWNEKNKEYLKQMRPVYQKRYWEKKARENQQQV